MTPAQPVQWSARRPMILGLLALILLVGGFGGWAVMTRISGAIIAEGRIEVERNRQIVQHPDGGVVAEILVDEGDRVDAGQVLIRLDDTQLASQLAITESNFFEFLARRGRLEAERDGAGEITFDSELRPLAADPVYADIMDGQVRLFEVGTQSWQNERAQLQKRLSQIQDQIVGIEAQRSAIETQLGLIERELEDQRQLLAKGLAQASRVLALQREQASLSGRVGELIASKAQAAGRITEIEISITQRDTQRREDAISKLRDLQYNERELGEQRRALREKLSRLEIRAPVAGVVFGLQVFAERAVIRPADPVLYVVPMDRPLIIASQVPALHVDQVYTGQDVSLRVLPFDQRNSTGLWGQVAKISADVFKDDRTQAAYYKVEVTLNPGEIEHLPEGVVLIPGMPVQVFLKTDDRSPMTYLLKPLADYFVKAFRES